MARPICFCCCPAAAADPQSVLNTTNTAASTRRHPALLQPLPVLRAAPRLHCLLCHPHRCPAVAPPLLLLQIPSLCCSSPTPPQPAVLQPPLSPFPSPASTVFFATLTVVPPSLIKRVSMTAKLARERLCPTLVSGFSEYVQGLGIKAGTWNGPGSLECYASGGSRSRVCRCCCCSRNEPNSTRILFDPQVTAGADLNPKP